MLMTSADNKMDYLRYYPSVALQLPAIAGFIMGGQWVWLGFSTFFYSSPPTHCRPRTTPRTILLILCWTTWCFIFRGS